MKKGGGLFKALYQPSYSYFVFDSPNSTTTSRGEIFCSLVRDMVDNNIASTLR